MTRVYALLFVLSLPTAAMAQGSVCSERTIRDAAQNRTIAETDDSFFWSGAYEKPLIGKAEREEARKKLQAESPRKNQTGTQNPQRIEVSKSSDMAYEYGTSELSFDDQKTGKHVVVHSAYLRAWKAVDGECKVAATIIRTIDSTLKSQ